MIGDSKTVLGNIEIPFLSRVIFNSVFSHEKTYNSRHKTK